MAGRGGERVGRLDPEQRRHDGSPTVKFVAAAQRRPRATEGRRGFVSTQRFRGYKVCDNTGTSMMFFGLFWILTCAALCIRSSTSSNAGVSHPLVSLTCNETVEVEAGKTLTLNCTIQLLGEDCPGDEYVWEDSNNNNICNSTTYGTVNYTCEWDGETYVSLVIREVTENLTYTVKILTDCGEGQSSIRVKVQQNHGQTSGLSHKLYTTPLPNPEQDSSTVTVIGTVFIIVSVLGSLCALLTTRRGKEILKCVKRGKNPEYMDASQDSA